MAVVEDLVWKISKFGRLVWEDFGRIVLGDLGYFDILGDLGGVSGCLWHAKGSILQPAIPVSIGEVQHIGEDQLITSSQEEQFPIRLVVPS